MTIDQILSMAYELGTAISNSEFIGSLREIETRISDNQEASDLINRYQIARTQVENKIRDGLDIMPEEEEHMQMLQEELNSHSMIQELIQVQEKLNNLMQGVYFAINQAMSGEECSSDCSSCGGSCGMPS